MNKGHIILYIGSALLMLVVVVFLSFRLLNENEAEEEVVPIVKQEVKRSRKNSRKLRLAERRKRLRNRRKHKKTDGPSEKGLIEVDVISDQLSKMENPQDKIDLMDQLWDVDDPALPKLVAEMLNDKDKQVRLSALELLDNKQKGEILDCIEKALDDPDKDIRELGVVLLSDANAPEKSQQLLVKSIDDSSENVREATFDVVGGKSTSVQEYVYAQSIISPHKDVKEMTVDLIMDIPSHRVVETLFLGLNDKNQEFQELINSKMDFLFSREFKNSNEAMAWWNKNKDKYDDELFEK